MTATTLRFATRSIASIHLTDEKLENLHVRSSGESWRRLLQVQMAASDPNRKSGSSTSTQRPSACTRLLSSEAASRPPVDARQSLRRDRNALSHYCISSCSFHPDTL